MSSCLVTKLNGVVNNPNLPVLGDLKLGTLSSGTELQFQLNGFGNKLEAVGEGATIKLGSTLVSNPYVMADSNGSSIGISAGSEDCDVVIHDKYNLSYVATYYNRQGFTPAYNFYDFQYCLKLHGFDNRVASGLSGSYTELVEKMLANGRTSGNLWVSGNNLITIFNGTSIVTPNTSTWYRFLFKAGGYELYTATNNSDMNGTLLYDSTNP